MLIRTLEEMENGGRLITINQGKSSALRMLNASDGMGFSLSEARGQPGGNATLWYKNHWEANYVRQGSGTLEDLTTGETWNLEPGVLYCVGPKDRHRLQNDGGDGFRMISVFNPPLSGGESHDADGSYPPNGDIPPGQERMFVKTWDQAAEKGHVIEKDNGSSRSARILTAPDGLGFAMCDVRFRAGRAADLWYKNHWEANIILSGTIELTERASGVVHTLGTGAVYCVGPDDAHNLKAVSDVHLLSVFNPPIEGDSRHDSDGALPPSGPLPAGPNPR